MAIITELCVQKKNKNRVNIYLDGEFFSGADALSVLKARLKVGDQVDPDIVKQVVLDSEVSLAFQRAANLLASRLKSEKEAETYLLGRGFSPQVVELALVKLKEYGLADNRSFSKSYVSYYSQSSGRRGIKYGLLRKGVDENTIDDALECLSPEQEQQCAEAIAEKYMRGKEYNMETKVKLYRHLIGKGFEPELVSDLLAALPFNS